jgi:hypothetical protein
VGIFSACNTPSNDIVKFLNQSANYHFSSSVIPDNILSDPSELIAHYDVLLLGSLYDITITSEVPKFSTLSYLLAIFGNS